MSVKTCPVLIGLSLAASCAPTDADAWEAATGFVKDRVRDGLARFSAHPTADSRPLPAVVEVTVLVPPPLFARGEEEKLIADLKGAGYTQQEIPALLDELRRKDTRTAKRWHVRGWVRGAPRWHVRNWQESKIPPVTPRWEIFDVWVLRVGATWECEALEISEPTSDELEHLKGGDPSKR